MSTSLLLEFLLQFLDGHFVSGWRTPTYLRVGVALDLGCRRMPTEPHVAADRKSSALVLAALIAPLLFVAGMYLMSRRTERMRQATIDGALKDYAAVAAWQLASHLGEALHQDVMKRLGGRRHMGAASPDCASCARRAPEVAGAFSFDPRSGVLAWAESPAPDTAYQRTVVSLVSAELMRPSEEPHRVLFAAIGGRARTLLLTTSPDDPLRVDYLRRHLAALREAMRRGVDLRGYFVWSLMDNFEWASGYDHRMGLLHVDYTTQQRTVKASGAFYRDVIRAHGANVPDSLGAGAVASMATPTAGRPA